MTEEHGSAERRIEMDVLVHASKEAVWEALTTGQGLAAWFPPISEAEGGEGGKVLISWGEGMAWETLVDVWEPGRHLRWQDAEFNGRSLAVDWYLEAEGGSTRVRLVHSGFGPDADWDDYYNGTENGWSYFLRHLRYYLEHHAGTPRQTLWRRVLLEGPREEAWKATLDALGLTPEGLQDVEEGEALRISLGGGQDARLLVHKAGNGVAFVMPEAQGSTLFAELEMGEEKRHLGLWLSTWGLGAGERDALEADLDSLAEAVRTAD